MHVSINDARVPETYVAAKTALAQCNQIDECKDWADKAEALAAYARMSDDDTLRKLADRIQARAVRRTGELLKTFQARGARTDRELGGGTPPKLTQKQAAKKAGLSKDQEKTAVRVANVPYDAFEEQVESERPPTVTQLAEQGKGLRLNTTKNDGTRMPKKGSRIRVPEGMTVESLVRQAMMENYSSIDEASRSIGVSHTTYVAVRDAIDLLEHGDLRENERLNIESALNFINERRQIGTYHKIISGISKRAWGTHRHNSKNIDTVIDSRQSAFIQACETCLDVCDRASSLTVPHLNDSNTKKALEIIVEAVSALRKIRMRIREENDG